MLYEIRASFGLTGSHAIARRYMVVNGFDGALTMMGLIVGFKLSGTGDLRLMIGACLGAAVALAVSGVSGAYVSESAEKRKELQELEQAMVGDLTGSIHERAARLLPLVIAFVNGFSPFLVSLLIIAPLVAAHLELPLPLAPLDFSLIVAFCVLFVLGVYLGVISGGRWIWGGTRALFIAIVTTAMIVAMNRLLK